MYNFNNVTIIMYKIPISLGMCCGITTKRSYSYWNELEHYDLTRDDLRLLDLSFEELFELYVALKYPSKYHKTIEEFKNKVLKIRKIQTTHR